MELEIVKGLIGLFLSYLAGMWTGALIVYGFYVKRKGD